MGKILNALLGKTFKSSKLKAALNVAKYRIALLKCHRQSRYNHACSNVINLLKLGQNERAILRVEQVIEEQNMLDVFLMIENYCQLLSERVRLIKLERECPEELKEVVTSLVYAASRCEDFPELKKISKKLTSRYGKEYMAHAVGQPSSSGVSSEMVHKLSARLPSMENRMKALHEIAYENNIILQLDGPSSVSVSVSEETNDRGTKQRRVKPDPLAHLGCFRIEEENLAMPKGVEKYKRLSGSVKAMKNTPSLVTASKWWNFRRFHHKRGVFPSQYGMEVTDHDNNPGMLQKLSGRIPPSLKSKMKSLKKNKSESNIVWQFEGASFLFEAEEEENQSQLKQAPSANCGVPIAGHNLEMAKFKEKLGSPRDSIKAMKKYRDAADAARDSESAAHAVISARAALRLSQAQFYDNSYQSWENLQLRLSWKDNKAIVEHVGMDIQFRDGHKRSQTAPESVFEEMFLEQLRKEIFIQEQNNKASIKRGRSAMEENWKLVHK